MVVCDSFSGIYRVAGYSSNYTVHRTGLSIALKPPGSSQFFIVQEDVFAYTR
jgi:hypothetical protein